MKLSAFPETTYKLLGTLRIQEVSAVSAKDISTKRSYSMQIAWKSLLGNMFFEGKVNEVWNEV